jgi:arabinoxylan arabinofuranohydrolase
MMKTNSIGKIAGLALTAVLAFAGCAEGNNTGPEPDNMVSIFFDLGYAGAAAIPEIRVSAGSSAGGQWPRNPVRPFYTFDGWFAGGTAYDAQTVITGNVTVTAQWSSEGAVMEDQSSETALAALFDTDNDFPSALSNSWKIWGHRNPLITQGFSADPTTMVYNDRVYLFASNDSLEYNADGNPTVRTFSRGIQGIRAISSADLSNWTDHGVLNVGGIPPSTNPLIPDTPPITPFETNAWAPSATWKMINGQPMFFLYFANSGNGIGVITATSPTGPWTSPLDKLLIDRDTPNCSSAEVEWLFDPGVFVDDDGEAYLYFGGGQNQRSGFNYNHTGYARRVRLNPDMISFDEEPQDWYVPYLFEACDMVKFNGVYYFSWCTNWNTGGNTFSLSSSQIAYMKGTDPMGIYKLNPNDPNTGTFSAPSRVLTTATSQLNSRDDNNHQNIFVFKDNLYIAYHAAKLAEAMLAGNLPNPDGGSAAAARHRSSFIDKVTVNNDATLSPVTMTRKGVDQVGNLDPYVLNEAETIGIMGGIYTRADADAGGGMVVTSIDTGDWVAVYGVDFGSAGAKKFTARVRTPETPADYSGAIELRLDPTGVGVTSDTGNLLPPNNTASITGGEVIGRAWLKAKSGEEGKYGVVTIELDKTVTGVHDLVFVFYSSLNPKGRPETVTRDSPHKNAFEFDQWQFFGE